MTPGARLTRQLVAALVAGMEGKPFLVPEAGRLVWSWFLDLSSTRAIGPTGPLPISYREMLAWVQLTRVGASPEHIALIRALDTAYLKKAGEISAARTPPSASTRILPPRSAQPVSAAAFDAMFP